MVRRLPVTRLSRERAYAWLSIVALVLAAFSIVWNSHTEERAQQAQRAEQAAQQRAGEATEHKLCITFSRLAANKPPAGNPRLNPSRRYDQNNHAILDELAPDLGLHCGPAGRK